MKIPDNFISCDWGTSNFRLRLVDYATLKVLSEHTSDKGIKKCNVAYLEQNEWSREEYFINYLLGEINNSGMNTSGNELIVASGMLSSSIGLREMDYVSIPVSFNGRELSSQMMALRGTSHLILVSGIRTDSDVLRGEETQAIGLSYYLPPYGKGVLLLPGTHSKHLFFDGGRFLNFQTYMTGELFDLFCRHSILEPALKSVEWTGRFETIFLDGVKTGIKKGLMSSLFSVRAKHLIYRNSREENYYYLSGLLIGAELSILQKHSEIIYLAASGVMHQLYRTALESFLPLERIVCFAPGLVDEAVLIGQKKILKSYV